MGRSRWLCGCAVVVAAAAGAFEEPAQPEVWRQVAIGGGGYTLQVHAHPVTPHTYLRTDVGGVYRRAEAAAAPGGFAWVPLLDWATADNNSFYSVNGLAMDPKDGATLYLLTGAYWAYSNCSVLVSTDAGASWVHAPGSRGWGLRCGGNEPDRAVGDRIATHPSAPSTIAVGGSDGAVWLSRDSFATALPTRVPLPSPASPTGCDPTHNFTCVVRTVLWLPVGDVTVLLAAVPSLGLFCSGGPDYADPTTWSFVANSDAPTSINRLVPTPASPGRVWATAATGGVWSGVLSGANGKWSVTWDVKGALASAAVPFSGIALDPSGRTAFVISMLTNSNQSIWRTDDGGASFAQVGFNVTSAVPWWGVNDYMTALNAAGSLAFDPHAATPTLWATDFFGVYVAEVGATKGAELEFTAVETGHEEVVVNVVRAPAVGPAMSGAADVGGWVHDRGLWAPPSKIMMAADGVKHNCLFSIDATVATASSTRVLNSRLTPPSHTTNVPPASEMEHPATIWVTAGDEYGVCRGTPEWCGLHSWVGVSHDGGQTFANTAWDDVYRVNQANPYRVAVHPFDGAKAVVAARKGLPVTFTRDGGATWGNSTGCQSVGVQGNFWYAQPLATDKQLAPSATEATVYYYNGTTTLFVSSDSGGSFRPVHTEFPSWNTPYFGVATPPRGAAAFGDVWVFAGWRLYHSLNGGANFTSVWSFYHPSTTIAVGPLPPVTSRVSNRSSDELAALCVSHGAARLRAEGQPSILPPRPTGSPVGGYAVYVVGVRADHDETALWGSVDQGHSWVKLSGANATADQGLGDGPNVVEPSLQDPGVVFVGTGGRGILARNATSVLAAALLACED